MKRKIVLTSISVIIASVIAGVSFFKSRKIFSHIGLAFSIIYAALIIIVYYIQL